MIYYRVRKEYGGKVRFAMRNGQLYNTGQYIANELYTERELKRGHYWRYKGYMEIVDIPKSKTYKSFGARFGIMK